MKKILGLFIVVGLLAGCAEVGMVPSLTPLQPPEGVKTRKIGFGKIKFKIRRGTQVGDARVGVFCLPDLRFGGPITWNTGSVVNFDRDTFDEIFADTLKNNNYNVVGNSDALFSGERDKTAQIKVGALVKELQINSCIPNAGWGDAGEKASARVKVTWKIYSRLDGRVIHQATTEGSGKIEAPVVGGRWEALHLAFGHAAENLLADQGFYHIAMGDKKKRVMKRAKYKLKTMKNAKKLNDPISKNIARVTNAVVVVDMGGGHGSGFFISRNGHFLTNHHVVKDAKYVVLKLASGEELTAEILRRDRQRDVAFGKVQGNFSSTPLPIMKTLPRVGNDVYAMGAPLEKNLFASSLTKGIVSALRKNERKQPVIQADVDIHGGNSGGPLMDKNGNVVGISVSGAGIGNFGVGTNFFIPIQDALRTLNIKMK